jgi:hypothetical protein
MWFWLFCFSFLVNVVFIFYVRWLLSAIGAINKDMENITEIIYQFSQHVNTIHELEMFYGDQTLKGLLDHSRELVVQLENVDLVLNESEQEEEQDAEEAPQKD